VRNGLGVAVIAASEHESAYARDLIAIPLVGTRLASRLGTFKRRDRELGPRASALLALVRREFRGHSHTAVNI